MTTPYTREFLAETAKVDLRRWESEDGSRVRFYLAGTAKEIAKLFGYQLATKKSETTLRYGIPAETVPEFGRGGVKVYFTEHGELITPKGINPTAQGRTRLEALYTETQTLPF